MIRVRLQSSRWRPGGFVRWVVVPAVLVAAGLGALRLVDQHYPLGRVWDDAVGDREPPAMAAPAGEMKPAAPPVCEDPAVPEPAPATTAEAAHSDDMALPLASPACARSLDLPGRLPRAAQWTSLAGRADGEYVLAGLVPEAGVPALVSALESMPAAGRLSYWRGAGHRADGRYEFVLDGALPVERQPLLSTMGRVRAPALAAEVLRRARQRGLRRLSLGDPTDTQIGAGVLHRQYECRASGALTQIRGFVDELTELDPSLTVAKLMLVPEAGQAGSLQSLRLSATLDLVLAAAGPSTTRP